MSISTDYASPIQVNGYSCNNCSDVAEAKKGVDPAHPKSGPYGVDAASDPSRETDATSAVSFGGSLAGLNETDGPSTQPLKTSGSACDVCC
ncbi:MAG: hypothetical protein ABI740_08650 [Alphaproteobacteria bacterium]